MSSEELVARGWVRIQGRHATRTGGSRASTIESHLKNVEMAAREQRLGLWDPREFPRTAAVPNPPGQGRPPPLTALEEGNRIDLNAATLDELVALPGIGQKLAQAIIAHRPYRHLEDLDCVPVLAP